MSIKLVEYFVQDCTLNGSRVGGVQTVSFDKSIPTTDIVNWGDPNETTPIFKKKQSVNFIFDKILSNTFQPFLSGFDIRDHIGKIPLDNYELGVTIYGGTSIKVQNCLLSGINFEFNSNGVFREQIAFSSHVSDISSAGVIDTGLNRNDTGIAYTRQHYIKSSLPAEVPSSYPLFRVSVSISIDHGKIPSYGKFYTHEDKYITTPVNISCEYEVLDLGYTQSDIDLVLGEIQDELSFRTIKFQTIPVTIDLGDKNKLVSISRKGGDAGSPNFSILTFRYENINNFFKINFGSSDNLDGNLIFGDQPILDGNLLTEISLVDGNN